MLSGTVRTKLRRPEDRDKLSQLACRKQGAQCPIESAQVSVAKLRLPIWISPHSQPALNVDLLLNGFALMERSAWQGSNVPIQRYPLDRASQFVPDRGARDLISRELNVRCRTTVRLATEIVAPERGKMLVGILETDENC